VEFGSKRAHVVATPSSTVVMVTTPTHRAGVVDVRVRTAAGLSSTVGHDRYRFVPPPAQVSVGTGSGTTFACDRTEAGAVACWGDDSEGELGNGTTTFSRSPVKVKGLQSGVRDISTGESYACAVTATHAAKCWGWEKLDVLGNGVNDINGHLSTPATVQGLNSGVRSIVADGDNTCAVTTAGVVQCWGAGHDLQLGANDPGGADSAVPVTIAGLPPTASVAIGYDFVCALTTTGAVYCWGLNTYGELGAGPGAGLESATPVQVKGLSAGVRSLSAGDLTACAVTATRAVTC
jgi:alpha-tubulin suppressor-like RCC1 family protein